MLNQARIALVEAEACTIFYEEYQPNHSEALYRCQYYLDDAALRLYTSCEHMLRSVVLHWALSVPEKGFCAEISMSASGATAAPSGESRGALLVRVLKMAEQSKLCDVVKLLKQLRSSKAWRACMKHRNDWVHVSLTAIAGLVPKVVFETVDFEKEIPPEILKYMGVKRGVKISVAKGRDISILRETVRSAYGELFRLYEGFARLLAKDGEPTSK